METLGNVVWMLAHATQKTQERAISVMAINAS